MKSPTAYYLLLLYATVALRPVLPLVNDFLAHTFANAEHLSTVHAHHGDHHLENELAEAGQDNDHEQNPTLPKIEDVLQVHLCVKPINVVFCTVENTQAYPLARKPKLPIIFLPKQSPPPKFFL